MLCKYILTGDVSICELTSPDILVSLIELLNTLYLYKSLL